MSDVECGRIIKDFIEYLNMKYYTEDTVMVKSHLGFSLILLKDLVELIEVKEGLGLNLYSKLDDIRFFKHQTDIENLIVETLKEKKDEGGKA